MTRHMLTGGLLLVEAASHAASAGQFSEFDTRFGMMMIPAVLSVLPLARDIAERVFAGFIHEDSTERCG